MTGPLRAYLFSPELPDQLPPMTRRPNQPIELPELTRSQETLSEEILTKMHAGGSLKPKYPVITPNDLKEVDGLIIGAPTRSVLEG